MALHLIRHPRPAVEPGVCYGRLDLALAEPVDAAPVRLQLPGTVHRLISSPARRCVDLARVLADDDFTTDPAWQELDFGAWEGCRWDAIDRAESDPWADDVWRRAPPGGETWVALTDRVRGVVRALADSVQPAPDDAVDIAVVTHAGPIRAVHAWVVGLDPHLFPTLPLGFGEVVSFEWAQLRAAMERCNVGLAVKT